MNTNTRAITDSRRDDWARSAVCVFVFKIHLQENPISVSLWILHTCGLFLVCLNSCVCCEALVLDSPTAECFQLHTCVWFSVTDLLRRSVQLQWVCESLAESQDALAGGESGFFWFSAVRARLRGPLLDQLILVCRGMAVCFGGFQRRKGSEVFLEFVRLFLYL